MSGRGQPLSPVPVNGKYVPGTEADAAAMLAKGDLKFRLNGKRLKGDFALIKMKGRRPGSKGNEWLMIKKHDDQVVEGYDAGTSTSRCSASAAWMTSRAMPVAGVEEPSCWAREIEGGMARRRDGAGRQKKKEQKPRRTRRTQGEVRKSFCSQPKGETCSSGKRRSQNLQESISKNLRVLRVLYGHGFRACKAPDANYDPSHAGGVHREAV